VLRVACVLFLLFVVSPSIVSIGRLDLIDDLAGSIDTLIDAGGLGHNWLVVGLLIGCSTHDRGDDLKRGVHSG
jgi:hypothetical protein